ncbi:MAG TPA: cell shape determination protein CcmA [Alphaproteobacteria bacterium]|jgi:cytoskeletal protein CcmA (bactofilin family)|nr:cell shape determination protein CcmA [Alphaproteobacteria bacterium]
MFFSGRDKNPNAVTSGRRKGREMPSLIGPDLIVSGNLTTQGDLHVDGVVEGDINCQSLIIGPAATVTGHIAAVEVLVRGNLTGNIEARTVTLSKTARVDGDILHETIAIEAGALLEGRLTGRNRSLGAIMEALPMNQGEGSE